MCLRKKGYDLTDLSEQKLKEAVTEYAEKEVAELPTDEELENDERLTFSEGFDKRIENIKKESVKKKKIKIFRIAGCVAAAVVLAVSAIWVSLPKAGASINSIKGLYLKRYEDHIDIGFNQFEDYVPLTEIETYYLPTYLPDGAKMVECIDTEQHFYSKWSYDNNTIKLHQRISGRIISTSAEKVATDIQKIGRYSGVLCENVDHNVLIWSDGCYDYYLSGSLDRKSLIKIAKSLEIIDINEYRIN